MKKKNLSELSDTELLKNQKTAKVATGSFLGVWTVLVVVNIYLFTQKGFTAQAIMPIALLPLLVINFNSLKEFKKEVDARNLK